MLTRPKMQQVQLDAGREGFRRGRSAAAASGMTARLACGPRKAVGARQRKGVARRDADLWRHSHGRGDAARTRDTEMDGCLRSEGLGTSKRNVSLIFLIFILSPPLLQQMSARCGMADLSETWGEMWDDCERVSAPEHPVRRGADHELPSVVPNATLLALLSITVGGVIARHYHRPHGRAWVEARGVANVVPLAGSRHVECEAARSMNASDFQILKT